MSALPWTYRARTDTGVSNLRLGMWLFIASQSMLFASLFSACVLLRAGAERWPTTELVAPLRALTLGVLLLLAVRTLARQQWFAPVFGLLFLMSAALAYARVWDSGARPATDLLFACWTLESGQHALHVVAACSASVRVFQVAHDGTDEAVNAERRAALRLYWSFLCVLWLAIIVLFFAL